MNTEKSLYSEIIGNKTAFISVDFANPIKNVKSVSGFLHAMIKDAPPDNVIKPMSPALWRAGDLGIYERVLSFGARFELVLSDLWGYDLDKPYPYEDFDGWEKFVRKIAMENKDKKIIWDIWNEPIDKGGFWKGSMEEYFETYKRAYQVLREVLGPDVLIGGPCLAVYRKDYMIPFLNFCKENRCEVNILMWHELCHYDPQSNQMLMYIDIPSIEDHLKDAEKTILNNSEYKSLNIKEIHINEIVGLSDQLIPASILGFFYYLERGKADGACRASWFDPISKRENETRTLDGMLTQDLYEPRAGWWVHKLYADGVDTRVVSETTDRRVVAIASSKIVNTQKSQILVGYFNDRSSISEINRVVINLRNVNAIKHIGQLNSIRVSVKRIPSAMEDPVYDLDVIKCETINVNDKDSLLVLEDIHQDEVYVVQIERSN